MGKQKYKLRKRDTIVRDGRKLYRIEALRDVCYNVKEGKVGGYVESEANLSQEGSCWIYHNACAYEDARVEGNAHLKHDATIRGKAKLIEEATLWENAMVQGEAKVGGNAILKGHAVVGGSAEVKAWTILQDDVHVGGRALVQSDEKGCLLLQGTTMIFGNVVIQGHGTFAEKEAILEAGTFRIGGDD